jgi:6-phosphogluconate dehydrogenase
MELGIVGLGKMGMNISMRLKDRFDIAGCDVDETAQAKATELGIKAFPNIESLINHFPHKKTIWVMVPTGEIRDRVLNELLLKLNPKDIVIDGTNSYYKSSIEYHKRFSNKHISYLDAGVSGGIYGLHRGFCLMVGGSKETYNELTDIFESLSAKDGCIYTGEAGSGHYVKMVHNAIEYGMMQSIAEGMELLKDGYFKDLDIKNICRTWNNGSIIASFLLETIYNALNKNTDMSKIKAFVADTGEGRWAAMEAIEYKIPAYNIIQSLLCRFQSQKEESLFCKMLSLMRNEFGGHDILLK